ncbi:MAG: T9SS type A sorting domain-containing protein [Ignavibacteriaceae bacterium]|nr:T9SS type A sorting domain-containing protein [Ignavibacteriaceae bacterium]
MVSIGNVGTIIINGTQYTLPISPIQVIELNPIIVAPQNQTINEIDYTFTSWSDDPNNHQNPRTFNPGDNTSITANFVGTPNVSLMNPQNNSGTSGVKPQITWTDACNVSKGVGSYIDQSSVQTNPKNYNMTLRVDAYYSTESTSKNGGIAEFTIREIPSKRNFGNNQTAAITEYKLYDNFPNPFNPSTEIYYQIPNDGNVKLKVYNMMGQEVMTLINGFKEKGMYSITFNASKLASGIYIYKLEAGTFAQVKKMILTK